MRNILALVSFSVSLTWWHLRREPARQPLLALRLLPPRGRRMVVSATRRVGGRALAYALCAAGERERCAEVVRAATHDASPRRLARWADFAVAADLLDQADELMDRLPRTAEHEARRRRLRRKTGREVDDQQSSPSGSLDPSRRTALIPPVNTDGGSVNNRVLHLVTNALPHTNAGYTQRTHNIARAQRAAGWEAHVLTRPGYPVTQGRFDARARVRVDGVDYHRTLPWVARDDDAAQLRQAVALAGRLVERLRPAVLHAASDFRNAELALALRERYGLPVVYEVRGFLEDSWLSHAPGRSQDDAYYRHRRDRETACMLRADHVVTLGEAMRSEIASRGVPAERITVVRNAVSERFTAPLPDRGATRASLGMPAEGFVVGTTTSCYRFEGLDTLLEAVALVRRRGVPARALIVGDGPHRSELLRLAARLGAAEEDPALAEQGPQGWAWLPGRVPGSAVRDYHAALDVFAVPRTGHRVCRLVTPLKPVEAMAGGLPVVASDLPALAELVEHGVSGQLIPADDPAALADALADIFYGHSDAEALGRAAQRWARGHTWASAAYRYGACYETLVGEVSRSGQ